MNVSYFITQSTNKQVSEIVKSKTIKGSNASQTFNQALTKQWNLNWTTYVIHNVDTYLVVPENPIYSVRTYIYVGEY